MAARVVIAGAGPAGIEAALGLRELAPEGTEITVVAPTTELRHQALGDDHFSMGELTRHPLADVCGQVPCDFVRSIAGPDRIVRTDATSRFAIASHSRWPRGPSQAHTSATRQQNTDDRTATDTDTDIGDAPNSTSAPARKATTRRGAGR